MSPLGQGGVGGGMQVKIARVKSARRTSSYAWLFFVNQGFIDFREACFG